MYKFYLYIVNIIIKMQALPYHIYYIYAIIITKIILLKSLVKENKRAVKVLKDN